jgi:hypothetical protein
MLSMVCERLHGNINMPLTPDRTPFLRLAVGRVDGHGEKDRDR